MSTDLVERLREIETPPIDMLIEAHREQRSEERFGLKLTAETAADMKIQVAEGRAVFAGRKSGKVSIWLVWWADANRIVAVYYSTKHKTMLTVLPERITVRMARS